MKTFLKAFAFLMGTIGVNVLLLMGITKMAEKSPSTYTPSTYTSSAYTPSAPTYTPPVYTPLPQMDYTRAKPTAPDPLRKLYGHWRTSDGFVSVLANGKFCFQNIGEELRILEWEYESGDGESVYLTVNSKSRCHFAVVGDRMVWSTIFRGQHVGSRYTRIPD